jgi:glyoxylase-like metal-dependent hydrolase (beta-lactamase superfamily II)
MSALRYALYVTPSIQTAAAVLPRDLQVRVWSPITSTLVYGEHDAALMDPLMTRDQATALSHWVGISAKRLTTIYITHGHGDHWFGLATVLERFPHARAAAAAAVVGHMREQMAAAFVESSGTAASPNQIGFPRGRQPRPGGPGCNGPGSGPGLRLSGRAAVANGDAQPSCLAR